MPKKKQEKPKSEDISPNKMADLYKEFKSDAPLLQNASWSDNQPVVNSKKVYYVRFHQPVPPAENREPVSEFRTTPLGLQSGAKYRVDSIIWTPDGVFVKAYGETNIISLANVMHCRIDEK